MDYKEFFENLKEFKKTSDIPDLPKLEKKEFEEIVVKNLIRCGAIPKDKLVPGKEYIGGCRNSSRAKWNGKYFTYVRHKFGTSYIDTVNHFQDDDGFDLFVPIKDTDEWKNEVSEKFKKTLIEFCKSEEVDILGKEFKELISPWYNMRRRITKFEKDYTTEDPDYRDFGELHESLVDNCIRFLKSHPELIKKGENLCEDENKNIVIRFLADGLGDSVKEGKWTPYTDSSLELEVGGNSVLFRG